jgi:predicted DNA-binding WGR domain protein
VNQDDSAPVDDIVYLKQKMDQVIHGFSALPLLSSSILVDILLTKDTLSGGKFWSGCVTPSQFVLRWGKKGTAGQKRISTKVSIDLALTEMKDRALLKIREGYAVVRQDSTFNY